MLRDLVAQSESAARGEAGVKGPILPARADVRRPEHRPLLAVGEPVRVVAETVGPLESEPGGVQIEAVPDQVVPASGNGPKGRAVAHRLHDQARQPADDAADEDPENEAYYGPPLAKVEPCIARYLAQLLPEVASTPASRTLYSFPIAELW